MRTRSKIAKSIPKPVLSIWQVVRSVAELTFQRIQESKLFVVSGSLAYTTILSIIPALAVSFAMFQAFGGLDKLYSTLEPFILDNLSEGTSEDVANYLRTFIHNARATTLGIGGFVGLVFTSMSMLNSVEGAFNEIWGVVLRRTLFQRVSTYWLFITIGPLLLSVLLGFAQSRVLNDDVGISAFLPSGTALFLLNWGFFFFVYKFIPNTNVRAPFSAIAALVTAGVFALVRKGFIYYTSKFVSYGKIYGSLGAIPITLLWIYIVWIVVLSGAALTYALQKRANLKALETVKL